MGWVCGLVAVGCGMNAAAQGPGASHALAVARAARVSDIHYAIAFDVKPHAATIAGRETLTFTDSGAGDLALDYRDGTISEARLNGKELPVGLVDGHLPLPGAALGKGRNELKVTFASNVAAAGKALTRYDDRDDQNEYVYTLFVPMDASMAFPCFDQPDLKARFALQVTVPASWRVVANTMPTVVQSGEEGVWSFPESRPISTYLFAFAAGPFEALPGAGPGQPTVWVRRSQLARAKTEAPQVQQMAARGIGYLEGYFAQPFPFPKYDLVLIPGFPFGGMEHAGETFLNEDGVLFRTAPTPSDYFRRNILVLHETTHQWFGDLVTMRWFDDLWLKEGFAQYMAYKALAELEPGQNPWKHFYEEIKPAAYGIDETQGTTPIFQNIANLKDAKSAYGAIVYQKAPSVLKQLNYFLGEENFRDGLRIYLKEHAYGNARWLDLVGAFEQASVQNKQPRDVQAWAKAWILQRGMPEVRAEYTCNDSKITRLRLTQRDVLNDGFTWPIANQILLIANVLTDGTNRIDVRTIETEWSTATYEVKEAVGKPCPNVVFANEGDYAYGRFLLDPASAAVAAELLLPNVAPPEDKSCKGDLCGNPYGPHLDGPHLGPPALWEAVSSDGQPLRRSMLWGALWDNVHVAQAAPRTYVDLVLKALPTEEDESLARIEGGHAVGALHTYMSDAGRAKYAPLLESVMADRMLHADALGVRIVNFRNFSSVAETPAALGQVKALLAGELTVPGMPLKPLDRWNLIGHLIAMNDADAAELFVTERTKDMSGEGQKYAYAAEAGTPFASTKARYFDQYLHAVDLQEDWITQSLRPFNGWNQTALTEPYLARALDALPEIKQHRKIFFLGAWLGAFIDGQHSAEAQAVVHAWLAKAQLDPDLRLKVLEVSDALDRTVRIRSKYPE
jgi:aminopeptidase N